MSEQHQQLFELTKAIVNIESTTGQEAACCAYVARYLEEHGFQVERQPVTEGRVNVLAMLGRPEVVMSTHMDTVPPFFAAREDEEFIYGRGACDAKGILAAQVIAALELKAQGVTDLGLLFVVGEETLSDGARRANLSPPGSKFLIDGEPTENKLAAGTKGNLRVDIRTTGKSAHSAYPHLGESAIEKLLDVLAEVRNVPLPSDPVLGRTTVNIGVIEGGHAANVIPDSASAQILFRTVCPSSGLRQKLEAILRGRCQYEFVRDTLPIRMPPLDGFETEVMAYTTDLPNLTAWGRPLLLGPGSIHLAHTDHECVRKSELVEAVTLYARLVKELKKRA